MKLQPLAVEHRAAAPDRRGPRRSFEFTFPQGMLWGLLACAANFAIGLVKERTSGTMGRLLTAPLTRRQILLGKALACFVAMIAVEALLVAVGVLGFGVRPSSWPLLAAAVLAAATAFTGIMMALSPWRRDRAVGERRGLGDAPRPRHARRGDGAAVRHAPLDADRERSEPGQVGDPRLRGGALARLLPRRDGPAPGRSSSRSARLGLVLGTRLFRTY